MAQKDYADILCQAVDEIISKKMEGIVFDKTINCTIIDDTEAKIGKYYVSNGSAKFYAYANSVDYKNNDAVYVTIPDGDYNNQKIIIGKQVDKTTSPFIFKTPFDTIVDVSTNLIDINVDSSNCYLLANNPERKEVLLWEKNFKENSQDIAGFTRLGIQGQFRSWLDSFNCVFGDYGYKLVVKCNEELLLTQQNNYQKALERLQGKTSLSEEDFSFITKTTGIDLYWITNIEETSIDELIKKLEEEKKNLNFKEYIFELSSISDMYGNPYNFESFFQQEKIFDISEIKQIESMHLYFYQKPDSFIDENGQKIKYQDNFGNLLTPNLFTKDPYICLGYDIATFENDQANIYCLDSHSYSDNHLVSDNSKKVILRWIHQFEDNKVRTVDEKSFLEYEIRWYKYKLGSPSADEYSGVYWERVDNKDNNFYYNFTPDTNKETESVKAIILFAGKPIRSNIIVFSNEKEVVNDATIEFLAGLNIWCNDNSFGQYYIYGPGNKLLEQYDVKQAHELTALFSTKSTLLNAEQVNSALTEASSITWTFPAKATMIEAYGIKYGDYQKLQTEEANGVIEEFVCEPTYGTFSSKRTYTKTGQLDTIIYDMTCGDQVIYNHTEGKISITRFGDINNGNAIDPNQLYFIKNIYNQSYNNNIIQCSIIKDNKEYFTSKDFQFGQAGTSGTDATLRIIFYPLDTFALTRREGGDVLRVKALLFDSHNREIDPNDETVNTNVVYNWSWKYCHIGNAQSVNVEIKPFYETPGFYQLDTKNLTITNKFKNSQNKLVDVPLQYDNPTRNEVLIEADGTLNMNEFLVLQCTVSGWGDYDLTSYKAIPIRNGNKYSYVDCASEILYSTSGYPTYYREPWRIHFENVDNNSNDGNEDIDKTGTWQIFAPFNNSIEDAKYQGSFKDNVLQPIGFYIKDAVPYGAQFKDAKNVIQWTQPIIQIQNEYPSSTLNKWNGKEIEINYDNGYILSPAIAAGKKNSDNTFSGVMLGDWNIGNSNNTSTDITKQTGLYGFHNGAMTFAFKEDGTAFIGKSGHGRILIDGNKSVIQSEGYNVGRGVKIDLDDNYIDMVNGRGKIYFGIGNSLQINFADSYGDSLFYINTSTNSYYLQSSDFSNHNHTGVKIDLGNGNITGYNLTLDIRNESKTVVCLTSDETSDYYPFYAEKGFIGGFSIGSTSLVGGRQVINDKVQGVSLSKYNEEAHYKNETPRGITDNIYEVFLSNNGLSFFGGSILIGPRATLASNSSQSNDSGENESGDGTGALPAGAWAIQLGNGRSAILDSAGTWILGKNQNGRIQLGTESQGGNTHIYCGSGQEVRIRDNLGSVNSIARFGANGIRFNVPAEDQKGIYARFA